MSDVGEIRRLMGAGMRRQAQRLADNLVAAGGGAPARAVLAKAHLLCGEHYAAAAQAREVLRLAGASHEDTGEARYVLATAALHIGDWAECEKEARKFLAGLHHYPAWVSLKGVVYYNLAKCLRCCGRLDEALSHYSLAVEYAPDDCQVVEWSAVSIGWIRCMRGEPDQAMTALDQVEASADPEVQIGIATTRAYARIIAGDPGAADMLREILARNVTGYWLAEVCWLLALLGARTGQHEMALRWARTGSQHAGLHADLQNRLADVRIEIESAVAD